jgi:hypothetical protein
LRTAVEVSQTGKLAKFLDLMDNELAERTAQKPAE